MKVAFQIRGKTHEFTIDEYELAAPRRDEPFALRDDDVYEIVSYQCGPVQGPESSPGSPSRASAEPSTDKRAASWRRL